MFVHQRLARLGLALVFSLAASGAAVAAPVATWDFDTSWAPGTFDSSGYGGGWVSRQGSFNSVTMDYASGAAYAGRSGGVAVITNSGNAISNGLPANQFAGIRLLLVDGPGNPLTRPYAFREAFEASMNRANNPYAQVDFWDDGSNASAGLFALGITSTATNQFLRVATTTAAPTLMRGMDNATVEGTALRQAGWSTLKLVLETDGFVDFFVNNNLLGTSTQQYETLSNAYDSAFSLLVGPVGSVAGARGTMVVDNFQFGIGANDVPEPGSLALVGLALATVVATRRRKA